MCSLPDSRVSNPERAIRLCWLEGLSLLNSNLTARGLGSAEVGKHFGHEGSVVLSVALVEQRGRVASCGIAELV